MAPSTEETAASLEAAKTALADAERAHAAATLEAEENRTPEQANKDLLTAIVLHLGNRPEMEKALKVILAAGNPKE